MIKIAKCICGSVPKIVKLVGKNGIHTFHIMCNDDKCHFYADGNTLEEAISEWGVYNQSIGNYVEIDPDTIPVVHVNGYIKQFETSDDETGSLDDIEVPITMPDYLHDDLRTLATLLQVTTSDLIVKWITDYTDQHRAILDAIYEFREANMP